MDNFHCAYNFSHFIRILHAAYHLPISTSFYRLLLFITFPSLWTKIISINDPWLIFFPSFIAFSLHWIKMVQSILLLYCASYQYTYNVYVGLYSFFNIFDIKKAETFSKDAWYAFEYPQSRRGFRSFCLLKSNHAKRLFRM